jgi:creatinine amidohydrolase
MTWLEVDEAAKAGVLMLVPVGVIEQHGPHLPLGTDIYGAYLLCSLTKVHLHQQGIESVIAPPYYFGINAGTGMFPGTLSVRQDSMTAMLIDLFVNYGKQGFKKQFIINHHGDPQHNMAIFRAILGARDQGVNAVCIMRPSTERAYKRGTVTLPPSAIIVPTESSETKQAQSRLNKSKLHIHAGEKETSLIMRWYAGLLKEKDKIRGFNPIIPSEKEFEEAESGGKWRELSPQGYIGDPSVATEENGNLYTYEATDTANAITNYLQNES